ncbi:MAG: T9SS type A sorting domain-containing protein [Bacteroidales bacterium]|nr:T9SS type A sorting domain-containing protein [Bacteroidales bacterium]
MKRLTYFFLIFFFVFQNIYSQNVNGEIISDTNNLTVVKIWGTHEERGFAYGYLLGDKIIDVYEGYIAPSFGILLENAKAIIQEGQSLSISEKYINEAKAIVAGMDSAGIESDRDYLDVLVANSFLDIIGLGGIFNNIKISNGCSSFMTWGDATYGTDTEGKSIISRHLDWTPNTYLTKNQVIVIHIPSESDEQPWLLISFAGQMSVLSGLNSSGISAFQHVLSDNYHGTADLNNGYEPIWFAMRNGLEKKDFNNDEINNVLDIRDALSVNTNGYADGYIVTSIGSTTDIDSLVALVAEIAPEQPFLTFRSNDYSDNIPGDNLYAANYEIKRNDELHYCERYNAIVSAIDDGTNISAQQNWNIMKNYSNAGSGNIQFMQFIPDNNTLKITVHDGNSSSAYNNEPVTYNLNDFFSPPTMINDKIINKSSVSIFPNPFSLNTKIVISDTSILPYTFELYDLSGKLVFSSGQINQEKFIFCRNSLDNGVYIYKITNKKGSIDTGEIVIVD